MQEYNFKEIESKWQKYWQTKGTYIVDEDYKKEKFYVLDMFPYPSGEGLHVGHPLGYIASDIYSRYKTLKGYNVLHPMGYDSFGLPAEQYAIQTGQHPKITTKVNINRYREQLDRIGFSYDWSREIRTSDVKYYKWTQWIFSLLFSSAYCKTQDKAIDINEVINYFSKNGNINSSYVCDEKIDTFSSEEWNNYPDEEKEKILLYYRLAFLSDTLVNWCEELGTVLANDEVKNGVSERGGHPVEQKKMRQWSLRITAYTERLLLGLDKIDFSESLKIQQKNWIGKSKGATLYFDIDGFDEQIEVFTTRPDTIFGVGFMTLAPEHPLVEKITTKEYINSVNKYVANTIKKNERERQADVNKISGEFTGAYAIHPITNKKIPIWIGDYVLISYGSGAVMAVPCGDQRDWDFAKHFNIEIINIFKDVDISKAANEDKFVVLSSSDFLNDLPVKKAIKKILYYIQENSLGQSTTKYRLRDAIFSRQRYWGEPFPVYYKNEIPYLLDDNIQVELPKIETYLPTSTGQPPLARAEKDAWNVFKGDRMDYNTMPGYAGSSWYFLRYMDPNNESVFADSKKLDYWNQVDLYIGGAEHAVGHLLYSRFFTKFLFDKGYLKFDEPFKKLINQGMIGGEIEFLLLKKIDNKNHFFSYDIIKKDELNDFSKIPIHINFVKNYGTDQSYLDIESIEQFISWRPDYSDAVFVCEGGKYEKGELSSNTKDAKFITKTEKGKMSKRYYNTIDPSVICEKYGADTLRCYEMFLGPLTDHKPWSIKGISGVSNFLKKLWSLYFVDGEFSVNENKATEQELKILHKTIKKITEDLDRYSFNTIVSSLMISVNELKSINCKNKQILSDFLILVSPYAPHIAEEIWSKLGNMSSITKANWPKFNKEFIIENSYEYPISFNGKMRFKIKLSLSLSKQDIEAEVLSHSKTQTYLEGKKIKKIIVVPKRIVNIVY